MPIAKLAFQPAPSFAAITNPYASAQYSTYLFLFKYCSRSTRHADFRPLAVEIRFVFSAPSSCDHDPLSRKLGSGFGIRRPER
jgi:hypothetical protein